MEEEIYSHTISYTWKDGTKRTLSECDIEHIEQGLKDNCNQGELCQYDEELKTEVHGWWEIETETNN